MPPGAVLAERAELVARLRPLGQAWGEVRGVLNERSRCSRTDAPGQAARAFAQLHRIALAQRGSIAIYSVQQ
jgi:hypothetical protein